MASFNADLVIFLELKGLLHVGEMMATVRAGGDSIVDAEVDGSDSTGVVDKIREHGLDAMDGLSDVGEIMAAVRAGLNSIVDAEVDESDNTVVVDKIGEDGPMDAFDTIDVEVEAVEVKSNTGGSIALFCLSNISLTGFEILDIAVIFFCSKWTFKCFSKLVDTHL